MKKLLYVLFFMAAFIIQPNILHGQEGGGSCGDPTEECGEDDEASGGDSCSSGGLANVYCPYWDVTYKVTHTFGIPSVEITCQTGGDFRCQ